MIYRNTIFSLLAMSMLLALPAAAQKYYSLEECVNQALKNNVTVRQRELAKESVAADKLQSRANLLPSVNGSATHNYNIGFAINPVTNSAERDVTFRNNSFGVNGSMVLFGGFQNLNNIRQQQASLEASEADVAGTKNSIALSVSNVYLQVLMNTEILSARKLQFASTQEQLKRQEKLYELGGVNRVKLLQLKAQAAGEEAQVVNAQTQLDQSYLNLWQLMNIAPDAQNKVVRPDSNIAVSLTPEGQTAEQIYQSFLDKSPEVKAAQKREDAARFSQYTALGGRSPRLTLSAGINSFYSTQNQRGVGSPTIRQVPIGVDINNNPIFANQASFSQTEVVPFGTQFDRNLGKNVGFTLSVPIFNGWQVNTNIQKSRINQINSSLTRKQTELDLYKNVNQAYLDYQSAQKRYESNINNFAANEEAMSLAETQFSLGALSAADFIVTKNQYLQAQTNLLQAKYELLFRRKVLDFYSGKQLY